MGYNTNMESTCPVCHVSVKTTDYFCFNCGKNLHEKPLETSALVEYLYYAASLLLPPLGLYWGVRYLRQADKRSKRIGWICIALTVVSSIVVTMWSVQLFYNINQQVNQQLQGLEGF